MPDALPLLDSTASPSRPGLVPGAFECISKDAGPDSVRVQAGGELDIATSPLLEQTLRSAELHAQRVVLDLRELTFIDSSGMRVIVDASVRARRSERQLILVRGASQFGRVFWLTANANPLEISDTAPLEAPVQMLPQLVQAGHAA